GPRLRGEENCPTAWTLHVPVGLHAGPGAFQAGPLAAARVELRRTETHLKLTKLLLESGEPRPARKDTPGTEAQLANAQRRFALGCRNVDELLHAFEHASVARGPWSVATDHGPRATDKADNEELRQRLESLQQKNRTLTDRHGLSSLRQEAERLARRGGHADEESPTDAAAGGRGGG